MDKRLKLTGSILGVAFDVIVSDAAEDRIAVTGRAGGKLVDIVCSVRDGYVSAGGTLLGNPFDISVVDESDVA